MNTHMEKKQVLLTGIQPSGHLMIGNYAGAIRNGLALQDEYDLNRVFPWGRSFRDYVRMFDLTQEDLRRRILGCADGPAAFNSEMTTLGNTAVSCDPLYGFSADEIKGRIDAVYEDIIKESIQKKNCYVWNLYASPEEVGRVRMAAMREFLADYERGKQEGRYLTESLPLLSFADNSFDLSLCSHFLFTYTHVLTLEFHRAAISEMCRVAREVRIFPLMDFFHQESAYVRPLVEQLTGAGYEVELRRVPYEFQRGGNRMLRVRRSVQ